MSSGVVYLLDKRVGVISNLEGTYRFAYDPEYCVDANAMPISLTMPVRVEPYLSRTLHPFFDGLIPEGWLFDVAVKNWKLNPRNRFELLLTLCENCIGAVSIKKVQEAE